MAPKVKRKSSSASLGQTLNTKKPRVSDGADCPPHVLKVLEWLLGLNIVAHWCPNYLQDCESLRTFLWLMLVPRIRDVVMPKGGPDKYLEQKYDCQEILVFEPFQVAFTHDYRSQAQLGNMFSQNWFSSLTEFASLKLRHSWMELYFWNCAGEIAWVRPLDRHILWLGLKAPFWFQFLSHSILPSSHQSIKKGVATTWCW